MADQLTEEDIKNMSPEELAELQRKNCIFCHIVSGRVPAKKIYEDDKVLAILDIYPATVGHLLLVTKEHYAIMPQVPEQTIAHIGMVAKALSQALLKGLEIKSTNVFIANGAVAGQKAPHFMIHIIPRKENDGINLQWKPKQLTQEEISTVELKLKESIKDSGVERIEKTEKPKIVHERPNVEPITDDEDDYISRQMRRIP